MTALREASSFILHSGFLGGKHVFHRYGDNLNRSCQDVSVSKIYRVSCQSVRSFNLTGKLHFFGENNT